MRRKLKILLVVSSVCIITACGGGSSGTSDPTVVTINDIPYLQLPDPGFDFPVGGNNTDLEALAVELTSQYDQAMQRVHSSGIEIYKNLTEGITTSDNPKIHSKNESSFPLLQCLGTTNDPSLIDYTSYCAGHWHPADGGYVSTELYAYSPSTDDKATGFYSRSSSGYTVVWGIALDDGDFFVNYGRTLREDQQEDQFISCDSSESQSATWDIATCAALLQGAIDMLKVL